MVLAGPAKPSRSTIIGKNAKKFGRVHAQVELFISGGEHTEKRSTVFSGKNAR
jgi:hypothetical protein